MGWAFVGWRVYIYREYFSEEKMDLRLKEKRAVVCGSTQGIGKAVAVELALLGAHVTLMARNEDKLKTVLRELPTDAGQQHAYIVADFNFPDQVKAAIEAYVRMHTVHILVNNTGGPAAGMAIDARPEEFMQAFASHLVCNQLLVQACVHGMKEAKFGRIINVISSSVKIPIPGLGVSNTIRGAVANWAKTLATELAPYGITVNNLLPGYIMTGRLQSLIRTRAEKSGRSEDEVTKAFMNEVPAGRIGDPWEIAAAAAFLASPAAAYINGINLPVDGGKIPSL